MRSILISLAFITAHMAVAAEPTELRWSDPETGTFYLLLPGEITWRQAWKRCYDRGWNMIDYGILSPGETQRFEKSSFIAAMKETVKFEGEPSEVKTKTFWTAPHMAERWDLDMNPKAMTASYILTSPEAKAGQMQFGWDYTVESLPPTHLPYTPIDPDEVISTRHNAVCMFRKGAPLLECTGLRVCQFYEPQPLTSRNYPFWVLAPNEKIGTERLKKMGYAHGSTQKGYYSCDIVGNVTCESIR